MSEPSAATGRPADADGAPATPEAVPAMGPARGFRLAVAGVLLLAAAVRLARWREAYWGPELVPLDGDALYHFRRTLYAARHLSLSGVEPYLNWPKGAPVPFAPGYDVLGAIVAWCFGGPDSPVARVAVAAMPVALGVLLVALTMRLAAELAPPRARHPAALAGGLFTALIPQLVVNARFGLTDHHVVEGIVVVLLARWAARAVEDRRGWRCGLSIALLTAGGITFFPGTPLYLAIAVTPVAVATLLGREREAVPGWPAAGVLAGAVLATGLLGPYILGHGRLFSFNYASFLQPALAGVLAVGLAGAALASRAGSLGRRLAVVAGLLLAVAACLVLVPGLARQLRAGIVGYLLGHDPWLATNDECQPIWSPMMPWVRIRLIWTLLGLALPFLLPVAVALSRRGRRAAVGAAAFVGLCMAVLTVLENRFGRAGLPTLAATGGLALALLVDRLAPARRYTPLLAPVLAAAAMLGEPRTWYAFTPESRSTVRDAVVAAAFDLAYDRAKDEAAPGVVVPWDMANEVMFLADRPVVADGFGNWPDPEAFEELEHAYTGTEQQLVEWMDRRRLGYLIAGLGTYMGVGPGAEDGVNQRIDITYRRSLPLSSTVMAGTGNPEEGLPHLEHLLPRFVSVQAVPGKTQRIPMFWTYERVPGALVEGHAPPGSRVVVEQQLDGRSTQVRWRAWGDANAAGSYSITVPLPTGYSTRTLETKPVARIHAAGGRPLTLVIPEAAVRAGAVVTVPPLYN